MNQYFVDSSLAVASNWNMPISVRLALRTNTNLEEARSLSNKIATKFILTAIKENKGTSSAVNKTWFSNRMATLALASGILEYSSAHFADMVVAMERFKKYVD